MKTKTTLSTFAIFLLVLCNLTTLYAQERILAIQEPFVIMMDPADGSILDPQFIDLTPQTTATPKGIIQVNSELWVSDQLSDEIYRYDIDGNFISAISGGLDNIRGMAYVNNSEIWVTNAGSNNGAPGEAIVRFDTSGNNLGFYSTNGSPFDVIDMGTEVYISYIGPETRIERRDYDGTVLGDLVGTGVVTFMQQMEFNNTNQSVYTAVFSNSASNDSGLYEFSITDGSILEYYDLGSLRGVAQLDDGNVLYTTGNNLNLLNTGTGTSSLVSAGGSSQYLARVNLAPCTTPATPTGAAVQTFDEGATVADLVADPTSVTWFDTEDDALNNNNPLDPTTLLVDGEDYFAVSIDGACISAALEVTVVVNCIPAATPTGDAVQDLPEGSTVADIVVTPTTVTWYETEADALANTNPLDPTTPVVNGEDYFAVNGVGDCPSEIFEVLINIILGVDENQALAVSVYPNPVTNLLHVSNATTIERIEIHSVLGQLVYETPVNSTNSAVDMSQLSNGMYLVTVHSEGKRATVKVIKE
ncbi:MAG: T9SS type A sorting domain-containing protein [Marinirhabdus sp.]|nr:T9SS type A sorting domain-containing protein [Marinirhabdus sp.]